MAQTAAMAMTNPPRPWTALVHLMQDGGHTTVSLGKASGLSRNYVSQIVRGTRRGRPASIVAIARVFGMTGSQLEATRPQLDLAQRAEVA